jgi:hypothetical protein
MGAAIARRALRDKQSRPIERPAALDCFAAARNDDWVRSATWLEIHSKGQDSLIWPEDDGCGEADGGHEGVGASIVTRMDASRVHEFPEHVLDPVTLGVEHCVVGGSDSCDWPLTECGR